MDHSNHSAAHACPTAPGCGAARVRASSDGQGGPLALAAAITGHYADDPHFQWMKWTKWFAECRVSHMARREIRVDHHKASEVARCHNTTARRGRKRVSLDGSLEALHSQSLVPQNPKKNLLGPLIP